MALWHDLRYGARLLKKSPAFTLVAVFSLALGIGANTAIFSLVNVVFFRSLPADRPDELVSMFTTDPASPGYFPVSQPNYRDFRERSRSFTGLAAYAIVPLNLSLGNEPEQIAAEMVTGNYFDVMGVHAAAGRTITAEHEQTPGAHPVVVLSHRLWARRFGGQSSVLGRPVTLNGRAFTIIGVMPDGFRGLSSLGGAQAWVPSSMYREVMQQARYYDSRRALVFFTVGRLTPGIGRQAAEQEVKRIAADLAREHPVENRDRSVQLVTALEAAINPNLRQGMARMSALLMTVAGLVLLIACGNVANLLLARAEVRRKEMAIRLSIGAGRGRLIVQLLTEASLLVTLGAVAGLGLGLLVRNLLVSLLPPNLITEGVDVTLDARVLLFTVLCSVATGIFFGLAPALASSRSDLAVELRDRSAAGGRGGRRLRLRNILVGGEVALSMIALLSAGLFLRSLDNARRTDVGFDSDRMAVIAFQPGSQGYTRPLATEFYRRVEESVNSMPGVHAASVSTKVPLGGGRFLRSVFPEGEDASPDSRGRPVLVDSVGTRYFETTGIPLLQGRAFTDADRADTQLAAIVNQTMAARFWPGQETLGKRFKFFGDTQATVVVGIARDSKYSNVGEDPVACAYLPMRQYYTGAAALIARVNGRPEAALGPLRRQVQALDPNMPLTTVASMRQVLDDSLWAARAGANLLTGFAVLALLLAAVGLYGVMAYAVEDRLNEIGIRMALGADGLSVLAMILSGGLRIVVFGLVVGLVLAVVLARGIANLLYGVAPHDPVALAAAPIVLLAVAAAACVVPAWRAARVHPMVALRRQ